ncbi:unnamed protein product [Effrenium voratum]|nr:unnamed protein product [Effrenium voratum]
MTPGDCAFVAVFADEPSQFGLLLLKDLEDEVFVTDRGLTAEGSLNQVGSTRHHKGQVAAGTVLKSKDFEGEGGSISGDHLVAYTGSPESPTLLCAVHMEDLSSPGRMLSGLEEGMSAVVLPEWPSAFPALCLDRLCPTVMWCATHFQYRWRCQQDGVAHSCEVQQEAASARGKGKGKGKAREETSLGDDELEELEFQRLAAELEDEHQELRAEARRAKRGADIVTPEMQADVEGLLEALGIPFVHAPAEAEAQCAFLAEARLVDAVASDDSDVLVFGAREVYRRMFSEDHQVECYSAARLETRLGLLHDHMIVLAMLLGCDYTLGVHGVGIVNGLEIVRAFTPGRNMGNEEWLQRLQSFRSWAQNVANWGQAGRGGWAWGSATRQGTAAQETAGVQDQDSKALAESEPCSLNSRGQAQELNLWEKFWKKRGFMFPQQT